MPQTSSPINDKEQQRLQSNNNIPKTIGHNPIPYETRLNPRPVITTDHHTGIRLESDSSVSSNGSRQHEEYSEIPEQRSYDNTIPASSPTKKLKNNKRLHQKGPEKQFHPLQGLTTPTSPTSSVSSPTSPTLHPISLTTAAVAAVKQEQFQRKESDESIRSSESDLCSGTSSSSDPVVSLTPDPEETPVFSSVSTCKVEGVKLKPSYAKEPWTGQTVEVKDSRDEGGDGGEEEEVVPPSHPPPTVTTAVKPRSKKKQKAQQKKEEKQRRKQQQQQQQQQHQQQREREREEFLSKKTHDFQESFDKESITSNSTNSTDNLDDETSFGQGDSHLGDDNLTREEEEQEISMETTNNSLRDDDTTVSHDVLTLSIDQEPTVQKMIPDEDKKEDIEIVKQEEKLVRPVEQIVKPVEPVEQVVKSVKPVEQVVKPVEPVEQVVKPVKPVIESVCVEEIEACPQNDQQDKQEDSFTDAHTDETTMTTSQLEPVKVGMVIKLDSTNPPVESQQLKDTTSQEIQEEPPFSPENAEEERPTSKIRPKNLDLTDKKDNSPDSESTLGSVEIDGKPTLVRLGISTPHELAASLLNKSDIIVRRSKLKGEKMTNQPHKENEEVKSRKKISADMSVSQDKRSSQLSHDAQPFYPIYPHYLPQQHPHIPPPPHHHGGPLLPSHPHRMSSPPYEYMPMRPGGGYPEEFPHAYREQMYDQRHHKRSDHQKPQPKGFIPSPHYPYPIEGMSPYHHDRPPPPPPVYEPPPEWMGSHGMHDSSHLEEDTRPYYASKRHGEMRGGHLPLQSWHKVPLFDSSHPGPKRRPHGSTLSGERGEYLWDHHRVDHLGHPSQSQTDDVLYLARYNHMRKMHQLKMEKQRQLELDDLRHDMYSLAQLRERSHLESEANNPKHYHDYDLEHESLLNEVAHLRQLQHNKEKLLAKQQAQESTRSTNLSLLLSPSSGWGPLNRAPGSQPGFSNQSPSTELASLFDTKRNTRWSPFEDNNKVCDRQFIFVRIYFSGIIMSKIRIVEQKF